MRLSAAGVTCPRAAISAAILRYGRPSARSQEIGSVSSQAPHLVRTLFHATNIGMHRNQVQVDARRARSDAVGVFHPVTVVDTLGQETGEILPGICWRREIRTEDIWLNVILTASATIRRDALPELPESFRKLRMGDWPMWLFASLRGPWLCIPKVMAAYRCHGNGVWSSLSYFEGQRAMADALRAMAVELPPPFSAMAKERAAEMHLTLWRLALASDRCADARLELREVARSPLFRIAA
jgi:hypothetical protein